LARAVIPRAMAGTNDSMRNGVASRNSPLSLD